MRLCIVYPTPMPKPVLLAIDDDTSVLEAVVQDLRAHYGERYRILRAASGGDALDIARQLKDRGDVIALFLSDQRMPGMSGVDFLQHTMELYPEAKRVLLTAYADTEAAIRAINAAKIHYYLNKPWDPPEEKLYPVLDDLLQSWTCGYRPPFEGIRVIGTRWSAADHAVRDFLSRNLIPYQWMNPDSDPEALSQLRAKGIDDTRLPVMLFGDGTALVQPTTTEIAAKIGLRTQAQQTFYDVVVVGAGPAGLAAAVYGASEGLRTLIVEPDAPGGQAGSSSRIENYLGFPDGLSGEELAKRSYLQASRLGAELVHQRATCIRTEGQYHIVQLGDGREVSCHVCILAVGVQYTRLNIAGEDRLTGAGLYYGAAMSEAMACKDEQIYIVGGANSAGQAALHFSRYAANVTMVVRGESLDRSMSRYLIDQIGSVPNITVETSATVTALGGSDHLEQICIRTPEGEGPRKTSSVFVFIGAAPKTEWLPRELARDDKGFLLAGPQLRQKPGAWNLEREPFLLETSVPGVFVAGDVRHGSIKRCASAVGEGSIAIQFAHQYLASL
jgi:thioredoxin reductase (NADPH)